MRGDEILFLIGLFLAGCTPATTEPLSPTAAAPALPPSPSPTPLHIDDELKQLAAEFMALRAIPGHFNGREWNEDVDKWLGRKHTIMLELGTRLGAGDYGRSTITALLGPPDHIVKGGDPLFDLMQTVPVYETAVDAEFLVYEWRSTHDFLFFVVQDGRITDADWWYAGE